MSGTYYCHNCEERRPMVWNPVTVCALCGSDIVDRIPTVVEEDSNDEEFHTELDFIINQIEQDEDLDDDEELLEERCLFEQLSSMYNHPIALALGSNHRLSASTSSILQPSTTPNQENNTRRTRNRRGGTATTIRGRGVLDQDDDVVSYDIRFEQRNLNDSSANSTWRLVSDIMTNSLNEDVESETSSNHQFDFSNIERLIGLYNELSDEESEDTTNLHRRFLDSLADILSDQASENNIPSQTIDSIISHLKKTKLEVNDPDVKEECIICQEEFGTSIELYHLPCQHKYHSTCITKWFSVNTSCPICRHPADQLKNEDNEISNTNQTRSSTPISISDDDDDGDDDDNGIHTIQDIQNTSPRNRGQHNYLMISDDEEDEDLEAYNRMLDISDSRYPSINHFNQNIDRLLSDIDTDMDEDDGLDAIQSFQQSLSSFMSSTGIYDTSSPPYLIEEDDNHWIAANRDSDEDFIDLLVQARRVRHEFDSISRIPRSSMEEVD